MSDSEDEFVSASEGEDESVEKQEEKLVTVGVSNPTAEAPRSNCGFSEEKTEPSVVSEVISSSRESLPDLDLEHKKSISSVSDSGLSAASLTNEKKQLLDDIIKEVEPVVGCTAEEAIENNADEKPDADCKPSDSIEHDVEVSLQNLNMDSKEETDFSLVPRNETVDKSIPIEKAIEEKEEKSEEETGDWDDWEADSSKPSEAPPAAENTGWDDWSLVDAKKLQETKATPSEKTQPESKKQQVMDNFGQNSSSSSNWGWGGIVAAVGDTFTSTIESSLGFPSAQEMARRVKEEKINEANEETVVVAPGSTESSMPSQSLSSGFGMLSGLVTGGIDVLEAIGKKTFEAVTVVDAKKGGRRRMMFTEESGENLSDLLKELKEKNQQTITMGGIGSEKPLVDVASVFGKSEGMAHLEALEMLSTNTSKPSPKFEREFVAALSSVDVESEYTAEFRVSLGSLIKRIGLPYEAKPIFTADEEIDTRLSWLDDKTEDEILTDSVNSFVEYTAAAVQVVAKLANLLLIMGSSCDWREFIELYSHLARRLNHIGNRYTEVLAASSFDEQKVDDISTQILMELSTALDFLRQSHRLLAPMFKL